MVDSIQFKKVGPLGVASQVILVCALFVATTLLVNESYQETGAVFGLPLSSSILFAPIFEEMIFRGWIFGELKKRGAAWTVIFSSLLFGLWHLKNIFYFETADCLYQMAYAAFLIGPILAVVRWKMGSIWPGVILHYVNNLASLALVIVNLDWRDLL